MPQDQESEKSTPPEPNMPFLRAYLSQLRNVVFRKVSPLGSPLKSTIVMGNPSADLDSFISALMTSYFYNLQRKGNSTFVPILNLPSVRSSDLWRMRPEYGVAVQLALGEAGSDISDGGEQGQKSILDELITIADVQADESSTLHKLFAGSQSSVAGEKQSLFLVDHNAPSIPGLSDDIIKSRFTTSACIDHHVDENYTPKDAEPRIILTGIGSCMSLVVKHLRDQGLWLPQPNPGSNPALQEIAKLALAPILIDTNNLKAKGDKCSVTDREVVEFLESIITPSPARAESTSTSSPKWDREAFHTAISRTKSNSLDLLTMQEIFGRDYKVWTEPTPSGTEVLIGISSLVRPLVWLVDHAGGSDKFLDEIEKFAMGEGNKLGVFCMLTRTGDGKKEIAVLTFDDAAKEVIRQFEGRGGELQLKRWDEEKDMSMALGQKFEGTRSWKIWFLGDTNKSRKQVGPLLREAVKNV